MFKKLIEDHFIQAGKETKDCWLLSIGYTLLGEPIKALNSLYDIGPGK